MISIYSVGHKNLAVLFLSDNFSIGYTEINSLHHTNCTHTQPDQSTVIVCHSQLLERQRLYQQDLVTLLDRYSEATGSYYFEQNKNFCFYAIIVVNYCLNKKPCSLMVSVFHLSFICFPLLPGSVITHLR